MQEVSFQCSPEEAKNDTILRILILKELLLPKDTKIDWRWKKRSIDARKREIKINCIFEVDINSELTEYKLEFEFKSVKNSEPVHIIGAGPAGLFAAIRALELGLKPIIFERGKDVRSRRRDLAILNKAGILNPESNYCFGEGGAGTYSDGKLYTRSKKRGDVDKVLKLLVYFGAKNDILVDAHPHVGTNKLPQIITAIREKIIACGGEIHFEKKLTDLHLKGNNIEEIEIQAKPFALGVRVEHTQDLIDQLQYHGRLNDEFLPPASYSLVTQVEDRGVYSFCMCPGGIIAPCATEANEVVTNGWSPSKRNNPYSNSGIVVSIFPEDFKGKEKDPFVCLDFQKEIEQKCWQLAGKNQKVPAQRLLDFVNGKKSIDFPRSSYQPGIESVEMNQIFPEFITKRLRQAFKDFDNKMKGFLTNDAVIHAPESRTSSPISIPRQQDTMQHIRITNLYPCAEGAGYAGGIVSAAIDGMNIMDSINLR